MEENFQPRKGGLSGHKATHLVCTSKAMGKLENKGGGGWEKKNNNVSPRANTTRGGETNNKSEKTIPKVGRKGAEEKT